MVGFLVEELEAVWVDFDEEVVVDAEPLVEVEVGTEVVEAFGEAELELDTGGTAFGDPDDPDDPDGKLLPPPTPAALLHEPPVHFL